jgi:SHS2 domain-containing protein
MMIGSMRFGPDARIGVLGNVKRFDFIEHTADTGIVAYGADPKEAFANAAYGMFSLMADLDSVEEEVCRHIQVEAADRESLVITWLNELLYLLDVERIVFKRFNITELSDTNLRAESWGEELDTARHNLRSGIKAATYHMLRVANEDGDTSIRVIFDV